MAFEPLRLKAIGGQDNEDFGGDQFTYTPSAASGDTLASIGAADFFLLAEQSLNVDDIIKIIASDGVEDLQVLTSTETGVSTVSVGGGALTFESLSVAGGGEVVSVSTDVTLMTSTAVATPTLAVGRQGQKKTINLIVDAGTVTLGVSGTGVTQVVFADANDSIVMGFDLGGWHVLSSNGAPVITGV